MQTRQRDNVASTAYLALCIIIPLQSPDAMSGGSTTILSMIFFSVFFFFEMENQTTLHTQNTCTGRGLKIKNLILSIFVLCFKRIP